MRDVVASSLPGIESSGKPHAEDLRHMRQLNQYDDGKRLVSKLDFAARG